MNKEQILKVLLDNLNEMKRYKRKTILAVIPFCIPLLWALDCMIKGIIFPQIGFVFAGVVFVVCAPVAIWSARHVDRHRGIANELIEQVIDQESE